MPIYEYRCLDCRNKVEILVLPGSQATTPTCPRCGGTRMQRLMSSFAYHMSEKDRLSQLDTSRRMSDDYYQDDRNIGLWAKKRMQELGHDPGPEFEGIVEKAKKDVKEKLSD